MLEASGSDGRLPYPSEGELAHALKDVLHPVLLYSYKNGRRWDEALWRLLELSAVKATWKGSLPEPVLDLGCGDGQVFSTLFPEVRDCQGVDLRTEQVATAQRNGTYREARVADARALPFADNAFNAVFSNSVVEHIDDVDKAMSEAFRVLRPGGHLVFTTPNPLIRDRDWYYWRGVLATYGLDRLGQLVLDREDKIYHHVSVRSFEEWTVALRRSGFETVQRLEYMPLESYRLMSKFSGAARFPLLSKGLQLLGSGPFSESGSDLEQEAWIAKYGEALSGFLTSCSDGRRGAGMLIQATKAQ